MRFEKSCFPMKLNHSGSSMHFRSSYFSNKVLLQIISLGSSMLRPPLFLGACTLKYVFMPVATEVSAGVVRKHNKALSPTDIVNKPWLMTGYYKIGLLGDWTQERLLY
ncbi:hypothetical protein XENTR_v10008345 [Xenopus tropicalis]|nr:hypothetical protein XENTR_v10008345 [Xenopus tropicalis]